MTWLWLLHHSHLLHHWLVLVLHHKHHVLPLTGRPCTLTVCAD